MDIRRSVDGSREAHFSNCGQFRYFLRISLNGDVRYPSTICFVMLNPSTADEMKNDPTVERCCRRAKLLGYDEVWIVNLFALRSTDPKALERHESPIGGENRDAIYARISMADEVVVAWGKSYPKLHHQYVIDATREIRQFSWHGRYGMFDKTVKCLGKNKDGSPKHPLYVGYNKDLEDYF